MRLVRVYPTLGPLATVGKRRGQPVGMLVLECSHDGTLVPVPDGQRCTACRYVVDPERPVLRFIEADPKKPLPIPSLIEESQTALF